VAFGEHNTVITTHILDTSVGKPARGVPVELFRRLGDDWQRVGTGVTDDDGRLKTLSAPGPLEAGVWKLRFDTGAYFTRAGLKAFYPWVEVTFEVESGLSHYHVPLLLSPWGFSTYRGS
jgi:5-hydroxyisourate hydrolase